MENKDCEIKQCLCYWFDLLGYGSPFVKSKWDLNNESCKSNFYRIENLRLLFTTSLAAKPLGTRLTFNDGFASTIDVDSITSDSYYESLLFLEGAIQDFEAINLDDKRRNFPGVRGIITLGQRFSYDYCNSSYDLLSKRTTSYHPMEFQMNTAFSKAFLMEESGSKAGISGNNLYIDIEVFLKEHNVAVSIGTTFRPSTQYDAMDAAHMAELNIQIELGEYLKQQGLQVIMEGIGHISFHRIPEYCSILRGRNYIPFMPLGPIVSDHTHGQDHITSAVGAAYLASIGGADIINAVTREEHTGGVPSIHSILESIDAANAVIQIVNESRFPNHFCKRNIHHHNCMGTPNVVGCTRCNTECSFIWNEENQF